jgi:hypothetical protein
VRVRESWRPVINSFERLCCSGSGGVCSIKDGSVGGMAQKAPQNEAVQQLQLEVMGLVEHFLRNQLDIVSSMLDAHAGDGDHKLSVHILRALLKQMGRVSETDITRRGEVMKDWWTMDPKWRHVLVFQFNFSVLMRLFDPCYAKLEAQNKYRQLINEWDLQKFSKITTLLGDYILRMERRGDYQAEIGDTRRWLLEYGGEYAQMIWAAERGHFCKGMAEQVAKGMSEQGGGQDDAEHCGCRHEEDASERARKIREGLEKLRHAAGGEERGPG